MADAAFDDLRKLEISLAENDRLRRQITSLQQLLNNQRRDLIELAEALRPFAELADVCDYFKRLPDQTICSWRIAGERQCGPTADDCRNARSVLKAMERIGIVVGGPLK